jgi:hypothetical protein
LSPFAEAGYKGLRAESVPPETIAKYAAPPLDSAVSRPRLHFGWRITGTPQVDFPRITRPALQERPAFSFTDDLRQLPDPRDV